MSTTALLLFAMLLAAPPEDAPARRDAAVERFRTLNGVLERATLIVEGRADSVAELGQGIAVVRFDVTAVLEGSVPRDGAVVLAAPGDFTAGAEYLIFLRPFRGGERFTWIERIGRGERDYAAKRRVLVQYVEVAAIADPAKRDLALRDVLLVNVRDPELFVRWNALAELESFARDHADLFGPAEKAALVRVHRSDASATFREHLAKVLDALGVRLEEPRR